MAGYFYDEIMMRMMMRKWVMRGFRLIYDIQTMTIPFLKSGLSFFESGLSIVLGCFMIEGASTQ